MHGREGKCMRSFVEKPEGNRLLGRPMRRWPNNIKMDIKIEKIRLEDFN
jgi:hypothetical protein